MCACSCNQKDIDRNEMKRAMNWEAKQCYDDIIQFLMKNMKVQEETLVSAELSPYYVWLEKMIHMERFVSECFVEDTGGHILQLKNRQATHILLLCFLFFGVLLFSDHDFSCCCDLFTENRYPRVQ